jgi:hypothetical protein
MLAVKPTRRTGRALGLAIALLALAAFGSAPRAETLPDHLTLLETLADGAARDVLDSLALPPGTTIHLLPETANPANWLVSRSLERALVARGYRVVAPLFGRENGDQTGAAAGSAPAGAKPGGAPQPGTPGTQGSAPAPGGAGAGAPADSGKAVPPPATPAVEPGVPASAGFAFALPEEGDVLTYRIVECGVSYPWVKRTLLVGPQRYGRIAAVRIWGTHLTEPGTHVAGSARGERVSLDSFPGWARPLVEGQSYPFPLTVPTGSSLKSVVEPVVVAGVIAGLVYLFYQNQK